MIALISALTVLSTTAPPPAQQISQAPEEDASNIRVDAQTGEAAWEAVVRDGRNIRRYDVGRGRAVKPAKSKTPVRSPDWTKSQKAPLVNALTEGGRWALQVKGQEPASPSAASDLHGTVSPDRKSIAFISGRSGQGDVYVTAANQSNQSPKRLSSTPLPEALPTWSPDGKHLAYVRLTDRGRQLIILSGADGSQSPQERVAADEREGTLFVAWRPDGKQLGFFGRDWSVGSAFYTVNPELGGATKVLGDVEPQWNGPSWLPDGRGGWVTILVRHGELLAIDSLGEQTVLQTGAFGVSEVAAAVIKGRRTLVFSALGLTSDEKLTPRYRKVYTWVWPTEAASAQ
jgi:hypothetical protein